MKLIPNKLRVLIQLQRGMLFQYGWLRSWWEGRPVDHHGNPIPWITYPAIDFLTQLDFSSSSVFEWGSGFSTLWWANRCKAVMTVESNTAWIPYIEKLLPSSVKFVVTGRSRDAEVAALVESPDSEYDVIVVDNYGGFRAACAEAGANKLSRGGLILLDNSDQCPNACRVLKERGFVQIDFTGFVPGNGYAHTTSIFFKGELKFHPRDGQQPRRSVAQPNAPWEGA